MRRASMGAAVVALALGCGGLRHDHALTGVPRSPHGSAVEVVMESSPEPPVAEEIGIVRAIGWGNRANLGAVVEGLQLEAAEIGADAVIRVRIDQGQDNVSGVGVAVMLTR